MGRQRRTGPEVSVLAAVRLRAARKALGWSMPRLSAELAVHRCQLHPDGVQLSAETINRIENGVPTRPRKIRTLSVDEFFVLCEVLGIPPELVIGYS